MQNHRRCSGEIWANLKIFLKLSYLQTFPDASIASKQVPFGRVHCILTAPGWIKRVIFTSTSDVSIAYLLPLLDCIVFEFRWQFSDSIYNIYTFSMTSLLTHTVFESCGQLSKSCQKWQNIHFQSQFSMSKIIRIFLKKIFHWRIWF